MSRRHLLLSLAVCLACVALTIATPAVAAAQRVAFTALHTYYMSPTGDDGNSGTSPSSPWATPNHSRLVCGDVIIAAPGNYRQAWDGGLVVNSQPSDCPSTQGGIDGTGGIYFVTVLCNGNIAKCYVQGSGNAGGMVSLEASNWAFEGFGLYSDTIGNGGMRGFEAYACASGTTVLHHLAFVNDVVAHANTAYDTNECAMNHNVPGNGTDYWAVVGSIAQNANDDPICLAAIDDVAPANHDTKAGVHVFVGGNFALNNQNPACTVSDGEAIMFDTWDAHGYVGTGVIENNIMYSSAWANLQVLMSSYNSSAPNIQVFDNTSYHSNVCAPWNGYASGGMNFQLNGQFPWTVDAYNNIDDENVATAGCFGEGAIYAMLIGGNSAGPGRTVFAAGGSGIHNIFHAVYGSCMSTCDPGNNVSAWNNFSYGTNTYESPGFANTSDLMANHMQIPYACRSYTNTTACMGWNDSTQKAAANSVIADLTPTASGTSGKGYQPPGACKPDPYYPTWLKGIVYLQWDGTNLWEYNGLVQKPCGL